MKNQVRTKSPAARRVGLALALLTAVGLVAAVPVSAGPVGFQASGGWYTESEEFFLGAGARIGAATITVIPNIEWLFVEGGSAYSLNVDGTLNVLPMGVATGYLGAGLGWLTFDPENGDGDTDVVYNLLAGASFNLTSLKPFGQFKWVVQDGDDPMVFSLGLRF